ncbi:insulinase family protein [Candidatus Weimeria sp. HCP3S3_B5]|uniref:insulinase family protein n=1 Tax=Candidatus Weimeria sp. HCP3S3_B5 TaxID=3438871 RepID=UPI003F8AA184
MDRIPEQYELLKEQELNDIHSKGTLLRHKKSGAMVTLIENDDVNKVFYIGFRTTPENSKGTAHIIEHTVLCGSEKYPVKDPFVELVKGSMNTFLNAMTYPDKTVYPVASTNDKDFSNLIDVYMDAVFHPNIYKYQEIFRQEGWHYEMEDLDSPLTINGVVYNEMKGAFSSPEDVLEREITHSLYPDTTYGVESGGDPADIPSLSYEEYKAFHQRYYHPSNSYIYLYGNCDMAEKLDYLDREYLSAYDAYDPETEIAMQVPFQNRHEEEKDYPVSADESEKGKTFHSLNYVIGNALDTKLVMAFDILDYALLEAPGAPVRQAILDAGIGTEVYGGIQTIAQPYFTITVKGSDPERKQDFIDVVERTLTELSSKGLDHRSLLAGINSDEFKYREADFGGYPKGLIWGLGILDSWLYDRMAAFDRVSILPIYKELRQEIDKGYFEELISRYLLRNPHSSLVTCAPKAGLQKKEDEAFRKQMEEKKASLTKEQIRQIVADTKHLKEYQQTPSPQEDLEKIPLLSREDLDKKARRINKQVMLKNGVPVIFTDQETNGIDYLNILFDIGNTGLDKAPAFAFGSRLLGLLDTEKYSYKDFSTEVNLHLGSLSSDVRVMNTGTGDIDPLPGGRTDEYRFFLDIKTKFVYEEAENAMELIYQMLLKTDFSDRKRIKEVLLEEKNGIEMHFMTAGHSAAALRGQSHISKSAALLDAVGGVGYLRFVQDFAANFDQRIDGFISWFKGALREVLSLKTMVVSTTGRREVIDIIDSYADKAGELIGSEEPPACAAIELDETCRNEAFSSASKVNFVSIAGNFRQKGYDYNGALQILKVALSYDYLWINIRVKGGAYGCMAAFRRTGSTTLMTYRDPHLKESEEILLATPDYIRSFDPSDRDMTKYVIGAIGALDTPLTPSMEGQLALRSVIEGISDQAIQKSRDQVLGASQQDIRDLADMIKAALDDGALTVVGSEEAIEENRGLFDRTENLFE